MNMLNIKGNKENVQLILGVCLAIAGVILFAMGFYAVPIGEISSSVLVAGGEVFTFSGSLFGLDYYYAQKFYQSKRSFDNKESVEE